jgi:hypothetical protein
MLTPQTEKALERNPINVTNRPILEVGEPEQIKFVE